MAKNDKVRMPSSGAGLTSFYDESESKFLISPKVVIAATILITLFVIALNVLG